VDDDAREFKLLDDEKEKAGKIIEDAEDKIESRTKRIKEEKEKIDTLTGTIEARTYGLLTDDDAPERVPSVLVNLGELTNLRAVAAREIAKLCNEQADLAEKAADQFKAKRKSIAAKQKKLADDGTKAAAEIKRLVGVYQKIAKGMKDGDAMAADIGTLLAAKPV
jgi:hypothetical protein